ncbi:MAG: glycosyltransferase family 39 protein [Chloroflexi bacterium]|nr:glycosyltransferase family 39 protein [Chloroflexota bacterium]
MKSGKRFSGYLLLSGILLLAFALRLHNIDAFSFWTDEGLTPLRASYPISQILRSEIVIQGVVTKDTHPPLHYLAIHFLRPLLGETDFAYRYPSVLASLLLVPLLYQLGRRLHGRSLGGLVALLTAVNPLHIWYANEARMYSLFTLLMAGAAYALWRALTGGELRRWLPLYLLLAGLGLYTHYTAVFLIAVQSLFWAWLLWRQGQKKLIIGLGVVSLLAAVPLMPLTIPRLFTGAEAHYDYVSPVIMLRDVVYFFSLGLTVNYHQAGIQWLSLSALGLLLLGLYAANGWRPRAFLLSYLLAVVIGLMVGSLLKPMYQGVRHMMVGSPAFLLLISWAVVFAWEQTRRATAVRWLWATLFVLGLLTVVVGPVIALNNLYTRPDLYAKDDFRALFRSIEQQAGGNDIVVLNNAILLPLYTHYQQRADLPVTAVPRYPTLAVEADPDLLALVQTYDRIWLVTDPPADNRDREKLTQRWLADHLSQVARLGAHSQYGIVEALAFSSANSAVTQLPATSQPLDINWPDVPALHGFYPLDNQPVAPPTFWFALFWEAGGPQPAASLRFSLRDVDGREWLALDQPLSSANGPGWPQAGWPQAGWPQAGWVRRDYFLPLPDGLPPGTYQLMAQPLHESSPLAEAAHLGGITVAATEPNQLTAVPFQPGDPHIRFDNGLRLAGWETADINVRPGHTLPLTLFWQADDALPLETIRYELTVLQPNGEPLRQQTDRPGASWLPELPPNAIVREQTGLYIRPETAPGIYTLRWRLLDDQRVVPGRPSWRPWSTDSITLGQIEVVPWPLETTLPEGVNRTTASFGPAIQLYGYTVAALDGPTPQIQLSLTWQAQAVPDDSYLLFVHLTSLSTGDMISQADKIPGRWLAPNERLANR